MRLVKRAAAAFAAAGTILAVTLAGAGTATADTADTARGWHHPHGLIGDITVIAPVDVDIIGNTINILGVLDD